MVRCTDLSARPGGTVIGNEGYGGSTSIERSVGRLGQCGLYRPLGSEVAEITKVAENVDVAALAHEGVDSAVNSQLKQKMLTHRKPDQRNLSAWIQATK